MNSIGRLHFKTNPRLNLCFANSDPDTDCTVYREVTLVISHDTVKDKVKLREALIKMVDSFMEAHA